MDAARGPAGSLAGRLWRSILAMTTDRPLEASAAVDAAPERVWELVTDITRMGEWSPQCTGGRWVGRHREAVVGAQFIGFNRRGLVWWATPNRVVAVEPNALFTFRTGVSGARWSFRIEPDGAGVRLVHRRELPARGRGPMSTVLTRLLFGGNRRFDAELAAGMQQTVDRLKAAAEVNS